MQRMQTNKRCRRRTDRGNTILEFALLVSFLVPMLTGAFTIGMALTKSIQVSNVSRDAVILLVRATIDPQSGLDLSQTQNQRIIVRTAKGLGMNLNAQNDPDPNGLGVVVLSKVVMVSDQECAIGISSPNPPAPPLERLELPELWQLRVCLSGGDRGWLTLD